VSAVPQHVDPDSLSAVLRAVFAAREYQWTRRTTSSAWVWLMERLQRLLEWLEQLRLTFPIHYYIVLSVLTVVLVFMLVHMTLVVVRSLRPVARVGAPAAVSGPVRDAAWHLAEALRLGAAGRFAEALAHRFLAAVLELDERRVVQFHPSKTPAEYAREARLDDPGRAELAGLVASLYAHVFGGAPCDAAEWQRFDAQAAGLGLYAAAR
jgi:Domain of unknown function (DUF4129)